MQYIQVRIFNLFLLGFPSSLILSIKNRGWEWGLLNSQTWQRLFDDDL